MLVYILYILAGFNTWSELPEYGAKAQKRTGVLLNRTIFYVVCAVGQFNRRKQLTLKFTEWTTSKEYQISKIFNTTVFLFKTTCFGMDINHLQVKICVIIKRQVKMQYTKRHHNVGAVQQFYNILFCHKIIKLCTVEGSWTVIMGI